MPTQNKTILKAGSCDTTITALLDAIVDKNDVCLALAGYKITAKSVILTFDDAKCTEADGG